MFGFYKIGYKWMKVSQILIFLYFKVNKNLEYVYVLSNCTYYSHYISKKLCKN